MQSQTGGTIKIKLVRSPICTPEKHKLVVKGLGLRKVNQVVERPDTAVFRGMVNKVPHLLAVVEEIGPSSRPQPSPAEPAPAEAVSAPQAPPPAEPAPAAEAPAAEGEA
jgi:large subunit ribosomal protein L30